MGSDSCGTLLNADSATSFRWARMCLALAVGVLLASCAGRNYVTHAGWAERKRGSSEKASSSHAQTIQTLSKRASNHGSKKRKRFFQFAEVDASPNRPQAGGGQGRRARLSRKNIPRVKRGQARSQQRPRAYQVNMKEEAPTKHVVYLGYLRLQVRQRIPAVDAITAMVKKADGYIERLGSRTVVVRIPADDFDSAMSRFAGLGRVLARRIQALDVSKQFTDLDARLAVAVESRTRLLALLATIADVKERLRIVQEIKRLSERIEDIESSLGTLRNLVAYYTITIDMVTESQRRRTTSHRSPFPWVRGLTAHQITLRTGQQHVALPVAKGFVRFDEAQSWHARAADTAIMRAAELDNEPHGSTAFWRAAVHHELQGRGEILLAEERGGAVHWLAWRNRDIEPRVWLIAVRVVDDRLLVAEGFFPKQASWRRHKDAVLKAFAQLGVK